MSHKDPSTNEMIIHSITKHISEDTVRFIYRCTMEITFIRFIEVLSEMVNETFPLLLIRACVKTDPSHKISSEEYRNGMPKREILPSVAAYNEQIIRETSSATGPRDYSTYSHLKTSRGANSDLQKPRSYTSTTTGFTSMTNEEPSNINPQSKDVGVPSNTPTKEPSHILSMADATREIRQEQTTLANDISAAVAMSLQPMEMQLTRM
jgi:hypothetical protein